MHDPNTGIDFRKDDEQNQDSTASFVRDARRNGHATNRAVKSIVSGFARALVAMQVAIPRPPRIFRRHASSDEKSAIFMPGSCWNLILDN
jgi:hypothetical protein